MRQNGRSPNGHSPGGRAGGGSPTGRFPMPPKPPQIPVAAPDPYPTPAVTQKNPSYARMLQSDIAGSRSEMTAIYEYLYQNWTLDAGCEELAETLQRIAVVEMKHLRILGELVVLLGGDPKCFSPLSRPGRSRSEGYFPWNGGMLSYTRDVRKLLTENVMAEISAIDAYTAQAEAIQDEKVSAILLRLSQDEVVHKGIFESYLTRLLD